jgi:antirestriction protein
MTTATTATEPRIYVASLADYNAGRLHGVWIDAAQDADDIHAEVKAMLAEGMPGAEEWAIHDSEGFGPLSIAEGESFERVAMLAEDILEHGAAFAAWVEYIGCDFDYMAFADAYCGEWASEAEYAEDWFENTGTSRPGPALAQYIDWTAVWTGELESCGYWSAPADAGRVHVFGS